MKIVYFTIACVICFLVFVLIAVGKEHTAYQDRLKVQYSECKDRGNEVEWCIKTIYRYEI